MKESKLIRDNIPHEIIESGRIPIVHVADDKEYRDKLYKKLKEELDELTTGGDASEFADILEVLYSIAKLHGLSKKEIENLRKAKAEQNGSFDKKIILDDIQHPKI